MIFGSHVSSAWLCTPSATAGRPRYLSPWTPWWSPHPARPRPATVPDMPTVRGPGSETLPQGTQGIAVSYCQLLSAPMWGKSMEKSMEKPWSSMKSPRQHDTNEVRIKQQFWLPIWTYASVAEASSYTQKTLVHPMWVRHVYRSAGD